MSVSLNWDRLCIVCEKEAEELGGEETEKGGFRDGVAQCIAEQQCAYPVITFFLFCLNFTTF